MQKAREINILSSNGTFSIFKRLKSLPEEYSFSDILELRQLLSNEKARILHVIKKENPKSIYNLAKKLGRGFKSVNDDVNLLKKFGFIKLIPEKTKNRVRHRPELLTDTITINFRV